MTSELETCRSQLHMKERDFDQAKTEMENVKKQLQESQDSQLTKDKELDELKSQSALQKVSTLEFIRLHRLNPVFFRLIWNNAGAANPN